MTKAEHDIVVDRQRGSRPSGLHGVAFGFGAVWHDRFQSQLGTEGASIIMHQMREVNHNG